MNEMVRAVLRGEVSTQRRVTCQPVIQATDSECKCSHTRRCTDNEAPAKGAWPTLAGRESTDFPLNQTKKAEICFASGYLAGKGQTAKQPKNGRPT